MSNTPPTIDIALLGRRAGLPFAVGRIGHGLHWAPLSIDGTVELIATVAAAAPSAPPDRAGPPAELSRAPRAAVTLGQHAWLHLEPLGASLTVNGQRHDITHTQATELVASLGGEPRHAIAVATDLLGDLAAGLISDHGDDAHTTTTATPPAPRLRLARELLRTERALLAKIDGDPERPLVVGVTDRPIVFPLALGMVTAAAMEWRGRVLHDRFDFHPPVHIPDNQMPRVLARRPNLIALFSHYLWSERANERAARRLAQVSPGVVSIHGGPSVPRGHDLAEWMAKRPADIAVLGEGEAALPEVLDALHVIDGVVDVDRTRLADIAGIAFVDADGRFVRTADRPRIAELDTLPSPFLRGLFDHLSNRNIGGWLLETNRGCPYGCTFCDWGSATNSRVRLFDLERVFAEITWGAERGLAALGLCDANFGMFARDVEIARHLAREAKRCGAPQEVSVQLAKNTTKHVLPIMEAFADSGLTTTGQLSFQTTDETTLRNVRRQNIATRKYTQLAHGLRAMGMPLRSDVMLGLPGGNFDTLLTDLEQCAISDVPATIHETTVLPNAPMNDPDYRAEHGIVLDADNHVVATSSCSRAEFERIRSFVVAYRSADLRGCLRYWLRFACVESHQRYVDCLAQLCARVAAEPATWPELAWILGGGLDITARPLGSWRAMVDELADVSATAFGFPNSPALKTTLLVQEAQMPRPVALPDPDVIELEHDYGAWWTAVRGAIGSFGSPLPADPARLSSFGPTKVLVFDRRLRRTSQARDYSTEESFERSSVLSRLPDPVARRSRPSGR
jgi:radical SAM superfamily enzyme YgiQ (UPF0313 family)